MKTSILCSLLLVSLSLFAQNPKERIEYKTVNNNTYKIVYYKDMTIVNNVIYPFRGQDNGGYDFFREYEYKFNLTKEEYKRILLKHISPYLRKPNFGEYENFSVDTYYDIKGNPTYMVYVYPLTLIIPIEAIDALDKEIKTNPAFKLTVRAISPSHVPKSITYLKFDYYFELNDLKQESLRTAP